MLKMLTCITLSPHGCFLDFPYMYEDFESGQMFSANRENLQHHVPVRARHHFRCPGGLGRLKLDEIESANP